MLLLITRPRYDTPTHYLFYWAELIIKEAERKKVKVLDLNKNKAVKEKFQSYLSKQPVDIVIVNGHGNTECVYGDDSKIILSTTDNLGIIKNKKVFIRACDAGSILGVEIINKGADGFIGYSQPFMFPIDKESIRKPLEDELAGPILECSNQVGISLIKGKSVEESNRDSINKYVEKINECSSSESQNSYILPFLVWNMNCQVCYPKK